MSDRLDKELGRHIRAVFDAYEEPFDAGQWQRLQRKRRVKVITLYLRRSGAAAAAIALLVAASMFLWNTSETENPPVAVQNQEQPPNEQQIPGDKTIVDETSVSGEKLASNSESTTTPFAAIQESGVAAEQQAEDLASNLEQAAMNIRNQPVTDNQEQPVAENKEQLAAGNQEQPAAGNQHQPAESNKRQPEVADQEQIVVAKNAVVLPVNDKAGERSSRFSLGFVTTSLMNYADGNTASDVHFGAGNKIGRASGWERGWQYL